MNCPKCNHEISVDAQFCGNCGQPVTQTATPVESVVQTSVQPVAQVPVAPVESSDSGKAVASLVLGILGFVGSLIPIVGLIMGIIALVLSVLLDCYLLLLLLFMCANIFCDNYNESS